MDQAPVLPPAGPLSGNIHHGQIQHFQQAVISREYGFGLGHLAQLAVEALNGIGGIDQPPDLLGVLEVGAQVRVCFKTIKLTKAKCKREKQPHGSRRLFSHTA